MSVLTQNIDCCPYTGTREVKGKLRVSTAAHLDKYFDGSDNVEQVENVTRGNIYDVVRVVGFGDCEDVVFIDDLGQEQTLGDFFFEEVE